MIDLEFHDYFIAPFTDNLFLRRALVGCIALSLGAGPSGVFLLLRRMSLIGDTLAHSILPGAAIGFLLYGLSIPAMSLGGFIAGALVALLSGLVSRTTILKEDASLASFFMISMASGVMVISSQGNIIDLFHILFGTVLTIDDQSLLIMAVVSTISIIGFSLIYRGLIADCLDSGFLKIIDGKGGMFHIIFLLLVVLNMVSGFQALGSMMAVGLMILPSTAARFWARDIWSLMGLSIIIAIFSSYFGLLLSYHLNFPSGPSIILSAGFIHIVSLMFGRDGSLRNRFMKRKHLRH
jgi:zinc/manganese transport system permease protein